MRSSTRLLLALLGVLGAAFGSTSGARALTIDPNPFVVPPGDFLPVAGSIELVAVVSGVPTGGSVVLGSVDPGDTTLVFRADVTAEYSDALLLGVSPVGSPSSTIAFAGAGWIPGSGADIANWTSYLGTAAFVPATTVGAGQSYDLVFVSYDAPPPTDGTYQVIGALAYAPETFGTATLVPEPVSAALLGLGLAGLGALGRRRRAARGAGE